MTIKTLIVDDSALIRKMVKDILEKDPEIEVIAIAHNGKDAIQKTQQYHPDVITMDVQMPIMNGIDAVKEIMNNHPTPIVMLSALTTKEADITIEALNAGAVDFICKPSGSISINIETIEQDLIKKVKQAAKAHVTKISSQKPVHQTIKVLLADDSQLIRKNLKDLINNEPDMEVIEEASTGAEALQKVNTNKPDVIIMDIDMPVMNGVKATYEILKQHSIPIIIFSGKTADQMDDIKLALELGAADFIPKPLNQISIHQIQGILIKRVREVKNHQIQKLQINKDKTEDTKKIIVIGTSTGGPQTLAQLIPNIPANIPAPILIVQHMPPTFTNSLAKRLDSISEISVKEAAEGDEIHPGNAYIAPGDYHMTIVEKNLGGQKKQFISLNKEEKIHGVRPAVDITFSSAANIYGSNTIGVILTGMGNDGANAMALIKAKGGHTIAQDKKTSIIFGMPDAAIKLGVVDTVASLEKIPNHIIEKINSIGKKGVILT